MNKLEYNKNLLRDSTMDKEYPYMLLVGEIPRGANERHYVVGIQYRNPAVDRVSKWCEKNLKKSDWKYGYIREALSRAQGTHGFSFKNKEDYIAVKMTFL